MAAIDGHPANRRLAVPLSHEGGKFALNEQQRQIMCLLSDGRLLVSSSHQFKPEVMGYQGRLKRLDVRFEVELVDMAVIATHYEGVVAGKAVVATDMQTEATELFRKATRMHASDIHIRVSERGNTRVFFRIHKDLRQVGEHTAEWGKALLTTIYQTMTDVSDATYESMSQQDARISERSKLGPELDGIRIATSPQVDGQIMVLRLLYNDTSASLDPVTLGYTEQQADMIARMKRKPTGINIIGGPTGSGKSTTLQRVLSSINSECQGRKHIITVEDPPEYPIAGAVQTPVANTSTEEERVKAFQTNIKAAMRLDPDVIMIGEVRDMASAKLAITAAMTGHQVWTTVHANNALAMLERLIDLGVAIELICDSSIVTGMVCQQLVQTLCPHCKVLMKDVLHRYEGQDITRMMVFDMNNVYVRGDGCERCQNSGIAGRSVVAEIVLTDQKLLDLVRRRERSEAIAYWRNTMGGKTMMEHAIQKVEAGIVDPFLAEEVVGQLETI